MCLGRGSEFMKLNSEINEWAGTIRTIAKGLQFIGCFMGNPISWFIIFSGHFYSQWLTSP
jgi:hypothetical protein